MSQGRGTFHLELIKPSHYDDDGYDYDDDYYHCYCYDDYHY